MAEMGRDGNAYCMKDVTPYTWQTRKVYTGTCLAMCVEDGGMERIEGMEMYVDGDGDGDGGMSDGLATG